MWPRDEQAHMWTPRQRPGDRGQNAPRRILPVAHADRPDEGGIGSLQRRVRRQAHVAITHAASVALEPERRPRALLQPVVMLLWTQTPADLGVNRKQVSLHARRDHHLHTMRDESRRTPSL